MQAEIRMTFRMPPDVEAFLSAEADHNCTSKNAELIRAVRERMQRAKPTTGESFQAHPAAADHGTALQGGPVTHG
jgi:hypothetical protein